MLITIDEIKLHLREDPGEDPELDTEIVNMYQAAIEYCEMYINKPIQGELPKTLRSAILLIIGDLYSNREAQGNRPFNENTFVERLLHFHRDGMGV